MRMVTITAAAMVLAGCATSQPDATRLSDKEFDTQMTRMLAHQSRMQGTELAKAIEAASAYPLGSKANPVRASGPRGQRAYLARLRCADLSTPTFGRIGSAGMSPYDNIVDSYWVKCEGSDPETSEVFLDMYHAGYSEDAAIPGFGIAGGQRSQD